MRPFSLLFVAFLFTAESYSQGGVGVNLHAGFMVPHHPDMIQMMTHVSGADVFYYRKKTGIAQADSILKNPRWGAGLSYYNLGNKINGNATSLYIFIEPVFKNFKNYSFGGRAATGLGYVSRPFDVLQNPQNIAVGSKFNGRMQFGFFISKDFGGSSLILNTDFIHFSNGNYSQPNLGINFPSISLGFSGNIHPVNRSTAYNWNPTFDIEFSLRSGKRQLTFDDPRNIYPFILEGVLVYPHSPIRYWRGGINYFYDKSYIYKKFEPWPQNYSLGRVSEFSLFGGAEYRIGKFSFIADLGIYLYRPDKTKRMYYEGVGIRWFLTPEVIIMSRLKAHLSSADYFEWGISYKISGRKKVKPGFSEGFKYVFSNQWLTPKEK